jgi:NhaP-type Na+/H+ or K+/H+ antiporter
MMGKLLKNSLNYLFIISFAILFVNSVKDEPNINDINGDDVIDERKNPTVALLFMFFSLSIGIITMQILSYFGDKIPYTVVLFIIGIIISFTSQTKHASDTWTISINDWVNIDADLLLFVFLPPLIFGEAMNLNWHHVKGGFFQALLLAGPGVLIGAGIMGSCAKLLIPSWSWEFSMLFGSILSATDPVAVVSLLKTAGASPKLTILIVGESLMNDGTAMVLFTLFFNMVKGETYTAMNIATFFAYAALGSSILGIVFGLLTVRWLRSANRALKETDVFTQIAITLCCAYLVFFIAQYVLEISGVLACCGAGLMLAWLAPPVILSHETMHAVWGMIEWICNTLIFLLAGLIIGHSTIENVTSRDWLYLFILYGALMIARLGIICVLYPWLSTTGHKCTWKEALFMSWAGLRGALGMALALIVRNSKEIDAESDEDLSRMFFYVGGIAALTLIVNATLAQNVLTNLNLVGDESIEKALVMNQIKKRLRKKINLLIDDLKTELSPEGVEEVRNSCSLLKDFNVQDLYRDTEHENRSISTRGNNDYSNGILSSLGANGATDELMGNNNNYGDRKQSYTGGRKQSNEGVSKIINAVKMRSVTQTNHDFTSINTDDDDKDEENSNSNNNNGEITEPDFKNLRNRTMSLSKRSLSTAIIPELLIYVRTIFLEIVRVKYWHQIEGGKLPRLSHSAQFLLYSVDFGLDEVHSPAGLRDWSCLEEEINNIPLYLYCLHLFETITPGWFTFPSKWAGIIEARREKRAVYMLTSFIDAHEHAQWKIHSFVGLEDEENNEVTTPEELRVITESKTAVAYAKQMLDAMSPTTLSQIKSKQAARTILAKQADIVKHMLQEGLLSPKHAEEFITEISEDAVKIEKKRNQMYR